MWVTKHAAERYLERVAGLTGPFTDKQIVAARNIILRDIKPTGLRMGWCDQHGHRGIIYRLGRNIAIIMEDEANSDERRRLLVKTVISQKELRKRQAVAR